MKIEDAIREGQSMVERLSGREALAVHVLVQLAKRVIRMRKPIRQLANAIAPEATPLTQEPLFAEIEDVG